MDDQSLKHLQDEDRWANWPIQTMKKSVEGNLPDCGIVVTGKTTLYEVNMWALHSGPLAYQLAEPMVGG